MKVELGGEEIGSCSVVRRVRHGRRDPLYAKGTPYHEIRELG